MYPSSSIIVIPNNIIIISANSRHIYQSFLFPLSSLADYSSLGIPPLAHIRGCCVSWLPQSQAGVGMALVDKASALITSIVLPQPNVGKRRLNLYCCAPTTPPLLMADFKHN